MATRVLIAGGGVAALEASLALRALAGADPSDTRTDAILEGEVTGNPARAQAIRCWLSVAGDGWHAEPTKAQGSHVLTSMVGAGALALIPPGAGTVPRGERVEIELLRGGTLSG